jgi:hypothetical protein
MTNDWERRPKLLGNTAIMELLLTNSTTTNETKEINNFMVVE